MKNVFTNRIVIILCSFLLLFSCSDNNELATNGQQNNLTLKQRLQNTVSAARQANSNNNTTDTDYGDDCLDDYLCFDIVFPITAIAENGDQVVINSEEELFTFFENQSDTYEPNFVFPMTLDYGDGETVTVGSMDALEAAFDDCEDDFECFDLVYPIAMIGIDGVTTNIENEEMLYAFLDAQGEDYDPVVVYPIDVLVGGETVTINNDDELEELYESCDDDWDDVMCFDFVYPFEMISNGVTTTITDEDTFFNYIDQLGEDDEVDFVYPLTLIDEYTEQNIIVNNLEEFEELFYLCDDE